MAHYSLRELQARLEKYVPEVTDRLRHTFHPVQLLTEADAILFMCPGCFEKDGHMIRVCFAGKGVPSELGKNKDGQTVRWNASGTNLDDLALTPSIQVQGGCNWHGFVGSNGIPPGRAG